MALTEYFEVKGDVSEAVRALDELKAKADQAMKKVEDSSKKGSEAINKFGDKLGAQILKANLMSQAVTKAFALVTSSIGAAVDSALQYERSMQQQSATLRLFASDVGGASELLEAQSTVLERLTGIAQEDIRSMQNRAVALGTSVGKTDELVKASLGLANALDRDVGEVMNQLIKSQQGMLEETLRTIPAVKNLTAEQLKNGEAIRVVFQEYGDLAALMTEGGGTAASITELSTAWGNLWKAVARAALESNAATSSLQTLANVVFLFQRVTENATAEGSGLSKYLDVVTNIASESANLLIPGLKAAREAMGWVGDKANEMAEEEKKAQEQAVALARAQLEADETARRMGGDGGSVDGLTIKLSKLKGTAKNTADTFAKLMEKWDQLPGEADMMADLAKADGLIPGTEEFVGPNLDMATAHYDMYTDLVNEREQKLQEIVEANAIRRAEIKLKEAEASKAVTDQMMAQSQALNQMLVQDASGAFKSFANIGLQSLELLAEGAEISGAALVRSILRSVGQQTLGSGLGHAAQAAALLFVPGGQANGVALATAAAYEISTGLALMAGNLAMAGAGVGTNIAKSSGGGSGGAGGGSGGGGALGGGSTMVGGGGDGPRRPGLHRPKTWDPETGWSGGATGATGAGPGGGPELLSTSGLTVVINGPTFATNEEIGVAIEQAREAARVRGLI